MSRWRRPRAAPRYGAVAAALVLVLLAGCGGDAEDRVAIDCDVPRLATDAARPLEWIGVAGLPENLGSAVAEVRAPTGADGDEADVLPTFVRSREDGTTELQVPIHPSFRLAGGEVTVRIYSEAVSCDPVPLTIRVLEPAPGAMAEAAEELRATVDEILAPVAAELSAADRDDVAATLARSGGELPLLSIPALWTLPELERLEGLLAADALAEMSPADAEMLDAIAGRLELAERMRDFRDLVLVVRELTGEPVVTVAAETQISGVRPEVASPFQFASHVPGASVAGASASIPARQAGSCLEDRSNLFDIAEPAELDNLMRAQDYAERFLAGVNDQEGGSASGTVFGDIGAAAGWVEIAGKAGKMASAVWDAFSTVVLNTAEAYVGLLPGEMQLTVMVDPAEFEEDSEETGRWTASAVAASDGMKLTEKVIEKVMETALEKGLGEASIGKELTDGPVDDSDLAEELHEDVVDEIDEQLLEKPTSAALDALLESIGAKEVEGGFDIPGGCWSLNDMSASDVPSPGGGGGGGGGPEGSSPPPPLVTGHLSGGAVEFTDGDAREYEPVEAGTSRLEIRTAEGYRKSLQLGRSGLDMLTGGSGLSVGTTYAFGGDQYTAVTRITVNEIEVQINPTIIRVEPGDRVDFVATVRNALDTQVRWRTTANPLDKTVDFGDGTHEAVLITPDDPSLYPIEVEIESVSRGGARKDGTPVRKATAKVQLADPVIEIQPPGGCIVAGEQRQFVARVFGVENQTVEWDHEGVGDLDDGSFRASGTGRATIRATWVEDSDVSAEVEVQVAEECGSHFTYTVGGALHAEEEGELWGITGIPGSMAPAHLNATAGQCLMNFVFDAEPGLEGPVGRDAEVSLGFTAAFTGVPREQSYGIGRRPRTTTEGPPPSISVPVASVAWREELAQPDRVFASLGVGMKIDNDGFADGFTSRDGQFVIDYFDGERIEGHFNVSLEETEVEYPHTTEQRHVRVTGRFSHPLNTGAMDFPDYYYCGTD